MSRVKRLKCFFYIQALYLQYKITRWVHFMILKSFNLICCFLKIDHIRMVTMTVWWAKTPTKNISKCPVFITRKLFVNLFFSFNPTLESNTNSDTSCKLNEDPNVFFQLRSLGSSRNYTFFFKKTKTRESFQLFITFKSFPFITALSS